MTRTVPGARGIFTGAEVEAAIRPKTRHAPRQKVVSIENTANLGGGAVWPLETVRDVAAAAKRHGLRLHMDGARSEERRGGKECGSTCRSRWSRYPSKKKKTQKK